MAERRLAKKGTQKPAKGFTDEERAAMKERAKELKVEERASKNKAEGESDVLAKIAEMPETDRVIAERLHEVIKASAPDLAPKTWYGMPAYAKDGKIVCYFQSAEKFKARYATFGFNDTANQTKPRRRHHMADLFCSKGVDRRRRSKARRACEESGEVRQFRSLVT